MLTPATAVLVSLVALGNRTKAAKAAKVAKIYRKEERMILVMVGSMAGCPVHLELLQSAAMGAWARQK